MGNCPTSKDLRSLQGFLLFGILVGCFLSVCHGKSFEDDITLTAEQKDILEKFRDRVYPQLTYDYMKTDLYLVRWLRARDYNIVGAEKMLLEYLKYREDHLIDGIHDEDWSEMQRDYKSWFETHDKEGRPILYINLVTWDLRRGILAGKRDKMLRYRDKLYDEVFGKIRDLSKKNKNVTQGVLLINAEGFNVVQHACVPCVGMLLDLISGYETHHPGGAEKIIVTNTPAIAQPIVQVAKNALNKELRNNVFIIGTNQKKIHDFLAEFIDRDQLPPELGGTRLYSGNEPDDY